VHANTVSDRELAWMAEAGMPVSITPQTEITSARSMSVLRRAFLKGVPLSIGVDTPAILPIDMLGQLKLAYFLMQGQDGQAMHEAVRGPLNVDLDPQTATYDDVLRAGTVGGAYGMGHREDLGLIRAGALADVIVVRPRDTDTALEDPVAHLILTAASPSEVDTVVIGGQIRKRNARLVDVDAEELAERNRAVRKRILARMPS
jgi:5-methylthioadenosine/S-adenosylhomocysteine deaminase